MVRVPARRRGFEVIDLLDQRSFRTVSPAARAGRTGHVDGADLDLDLSGRPRARRLGPGPGWAPRLEPRGGHTQGAVYVEVHLEAEPTITAGNRESAPPGPAGSDGPAEDRRPTAGT